MKVASFDKRLEPAYRELARALARMEEEQGIVARRNAHQAYTKAESKLRQLIDEHYPQQRKQPKQRRKRRTPRERVRHLTRNGWKGLITSTMVTRLAAKGIKIERIRFPATRENQDDGFELLGPAWAVTIASLAPEKLEAAKRSIKERKAILVELALGE